MRIIRPKRLPGASGVHEIGAFRKLPVVISILRGSELYNFSDRRGHVGAQVANIGLKGV